jgi:trk system potassium uptake protein
MKVIVVGCGKLGSGLAQSLEKKGHSVTIIDIDQESFKMLSPDFKGKKIEGIGFDKEILEKAGISTADAIVASSKSDDANALIGRISRNIYKVPKVISRLYDPRRAEIYRSLGIQTISTTDWGVHQAMAMLSYNQLDSLVDMGEVELIRIETPALLEDRIVNDLTVVGEIEVIAISRDNKTFIPTRGTVFKKDDVIFVSVLKTSSGKLEKLLGMALNGGKKR